MHTAVEKPALGPPGWRVPLWWWFAVVLAVAIAGYSLRYVIVGEAAYVPELSEAFRAGWRTGSRP